MQELHLFLCLFWSLGKVILASFASSIFLVHSSINWWTNFHLHLQFSKSNYSPISHDLSHSLSQLLGSQIDLLLQIPLAINSLHSYLHLFLFQLSLLLWTQPSSLHLHLHVSCHSMCFVSLVLDIRLNTLTFKFLTLLTLLQLPLVLILKGKKYRFVTININNVSSSFTILIVHWNIILMALHLIKLIKLVIL